MRYIDIILKHCKKIDMTALSQSPFINLADILAHPELLWNWEGISRNPSITFADILAHPKLPWDWENISSNPSITIADVIAHPKLPWNWENIYRNDMSSHEYFQSDFYKRRLAKQFNDAIFEELIIVSCHPSRRLWYTDDPTYLVN